MNVKAQLVGLNKFLAEIYKSDTRLSTLLTELGFEQKQIETLRDHPLEPMVNGLLAVSRRKLGERYFEVISRRFGLEGEPADTLQVSGEKLGVSRERVRQLGKGHQPLQVQENRAAFPGGFACYCLATA
jgi:RNA polymerase nonessential primary-like sigma factor